MSDFGDDFFILYILNYVIVGLPDGMAVLFGLKCHSRLKLVRIVKLGLSTSVTVLLPVKD